MARTKKTVDTTTTETKEVVKDTKETKELKKEINNLKSEIATKAEELENVKTAFVEKENAFKKEKVENNKRYIKETKLEATILTVITILCVVCTLLTLITFKTNVIIGDRSGEITYSFFNNTTIVNVLRLVSGLGAIVSACCLLPLTSYIIKLCRKEKE